MAHDLWYAAPLVVVVSLVYAATRHEAMTQILPHAGRTALWIVGFMGAIYLLLAWLTRGL
ncbi:MAG: hypothetical protein K1X74_14260 [Pirellulales bacterium]|nr:hypothetical protein [Pirellulales bacterium]